VPVGGVDMRVVLCYVSHMNVLTRVFRFSQLDTGVVLELRQSRLSGRLTALSVTCGGFTHYAPANVLRATSVERLLVWVRNQSPPFWEV